MARSENKKDWSNLIVAAVAGFGFLGGAVFNGFNYTDKLATKPYVDDRFLEAKKYADERATAVLEKAISHSDANHADVVLRLSELNSDSKSSAAVLTTKVDSIISRLEDFQKRTWAQQKNK